jgi:glycosyltransferase involved in cell wall biosynthesis
MTEKSTLPLVSVVTPAYNEEDHLKECIESVLAQTYQNWEHIIVNNRSTDRTLEIAQSYAAKDSRIHVHTNDTFVGAIENLNAGLRLISPASKYCKPILADDWIVPECLTAMVNRAEKDPSVGIVGAYGLDGKVVLCMGLNYPNIVSNGREIARMNLLGMPYIFGSPTSLLFRSDLIRSRPDFYEAQNPHTDYHVCLEHLQNCDFGFVFQILTFSRKREDSRTTSSTLYNTIPLGNLAAVVKYGPIFLTAEELRERLKVRSRLYYLHLATNVLRLREKKFWNYHRQKLAELGLRLDRVQLFAAVCSEVLSNLTHPLPAARKAWTWWSRAFQRLRAKVLGLPAEKQNSLRGNL